jgi:hypothetical protein
MNNGMPPDFKSRTVPQFWAGRFGSKTVRQMHGGRFGWLVAAGKRHLYSLAKPAKAAL